MPVDVSDEITRLIDGWCERRALRPLGIVLSSWPPNGLTDEWVQVWAVMRHLRAVCRQELALHGESDAVNEIIAQLSSRLFPHREPQMIEETAERLINTILGDLDTGRSQHT